MMDWLKCDSVCLSVSQPPPMNGPPSLPATSPFSLFVLSHSMCPIHQSLNFVYCTGSCMHAVAAVYLQEGVASVTHFDCLWTHLLFCDELCNHSHVGSPLRRNGVHLI